MSLDDAGLIIIDRLSAKIEELLLIPDLLATRTEDYLKRIQNNLDRLRLMWLDCYDEHIWHNLIHDIRTPVAVITTSHYLLVRTMPQALADEMTNDWQELKLKITLLQSKVEQVGAVQNYKYHSRASTLRGVEACVDLDGAALMDLMLDKIVELRIQSNWTKDEHLQLEDIHQTLLSLNTAWQTMENPNGIELSLMRSHIRYSLIAVSLLEFGLKHDIVKLQSIRKLSEIIDKKLDAMLNQVQVA